VLHVNDIVEWVNADIFQHTATAADGSFDVDLPAGAKGRTILKRVGVVDYFCRFHPGMQGRLSGSHLQQARMTKTLIEISLHLVAAHVERPFDPDFCTL
jgi:hypothetical protein